MTATFNLVTSAPTVTEVSAEDSGTTAGGTAVTIKGTNLTGATEVKYGTTAVTCTGVIATCKVESATEIKATTPAHAAATVDVRVITPGGESAVNAPADQFTFVTPPSPPTVTEVTPSSGTTAGGTAVTIKGTNLTGATEVKYGTTAVTCTGVIATCKVESATEIKATTPAHAAATVDVRVITPGGESAVNAPADQFTFVTPPSPPTVTEVTPSSGTTAGGTAVTIKGTNLTGATEVKYGTTAVTCTGVIATCKVESATEIKATTPAHAAATVDVRVITPGGESAVNAPADQFTFVTPPSPPTVTEVTPSSGTTAGGTAVTIKGTNLTGATEVKYGTTAVTCTGVIATCKVESATEIKATTPAHAAATVDVRVITPGGESAVNAPADQFTFVTPPSPPTVTEVTPSSGTTAGGTAVTIKGTNLTGATEVKYGTTAVTCTGVIATCKVESATEIKATTPAHAAATVDVRVITPGGESAVNAPADQFTFVTMRTLTITKAGTGTGTVKCEINAGPSEACAGAGSYPNGTSVKLTATASGGSEFTGFSSGTGSASSCSTSPCTFTIEANSAVTATFNVEPPSEFALTVSLAGTGTGTVTSSPAGINCGIDCSEAFASGTEVTLTASSSSGSTFSGWSGACVGTGACKVTMSATRSVTATFTKESTPPPPGPGTAVVASTAKVKGGKALLKLTCKGEGACAGSLKLTAKIGGKKKVIGKGSFRLSAGASTTLKVKLSGAAKTALKKGPLKAKVSGSGVASSTVKLKLAR